MGFVARLATKSMCATIRKSLPNASVEKLMQHYNKLIELRRAADDMEDWKLSHEVLELSFDVGDELERRGVETQWSRAAAEARRA